METEVPWTCVICKKPIAPTEDVTRYNSGWAHWNCYRKTLPQSKGNDQ